jgi:hypothetical protein
MLYQVVWALLAIQLQTQVFIPEQYHLFTNNEETWKGLFPFLLNPMSCCSLQSTKMSSHLLDAKHWSWQLCIFFNISNFHLYVGFHHVFKRKLKWKTYQSACTCGKQRTETLCLDLALSQDSMPATLKFLTSFLSFSMQVETWSFGSGWCKYYSSAKFAVFNSQFYMFLRLSNSNGELN